MSHAYFMRWIQTDTNRDEAQQLHVNHPDHQVLLTAVREIRFSSTALSFSPCFVAVTCNIYRSIEEVFLVMLGQFDFVQILAKN